MDPFQIVHADLKKPVVLFGGRGTDRYQHAGIINHYPVGSMILGDSHAANFLPSKLENQLGVKNAHSFTMDGSTIFEQTFPGCYAFDKREVEYVLWGVSSWKLRQDFKARNPKMQLPGYLYDAGRLNDLKFFLSLDFFKYNSPKIKRKQEIIGGGNPEQLQHQEFDRATAWYWLAEKRFNRPVYVADKILKKRKLVYTSSQLAALHPQSPAVFLDALDTRTPHPKKIMDRSQKNIRHNILPLIKNNPQTKFDFVFSAYPTLWTQVRKIYMPETYYLELAVLKNFIEMTSPYPNVRVFAFGLEKFVDDLRLYKDESHFHIEVNHHMIESIAQNKNILTKDNIDTYLYRFDKRVNDYRLKKEWNPCFQKKNFSKGEKMSMSDAKKFIKGVL